MIYIVISVTASDLPDTNTVSSDPATDTVVTGPNTQNPTDTNTKSCDGPVVTTVATDNLSSTSSTGFNFDPSATGGMTLSGENFQRPTWIDKSCMICA
ncbi:10456_t:CDS:2 [Entrophospora sp. SA101]|nr:10456_t:CDS:2 [Entrophospora sp. SA101]